MREPPEDTQGDETYDFEKMQHIVSALDFLRQEAANTGVDDIKTIVDSAFKMVLSAYTLVLRYECVNNPSPEQIQ